MPRITNTEREYLQKRVHQEFTPLIRKASDALTPLKQEIRDKLMIEMGVDQLDMKILALQKEVADLQMKRNEVMGHRTAISGNTVFTREVDRRVMARPESKLLIQLQEAQTKAIDEVMMAEVSPDLKKFIEQLPATLLPLTKEIKKLTGRNNE